MGFSNSDILLYPSEKSCLWISSGHLINFSIQSYFSISNTNINIKIPYVNHRDYFEIIDSEIENFNYSGYSLFINVNPIKNLQYKFFYDDFQINIKGDLINNSKVEIFQSNDFLKTIQLKKLSTRDQVFNLSRSSELDLFFHPNTAFLIHNPTQFNSIINNSEIIYINSSNSNYGSYIIDNNTSLKVIRKTKSNNELFYISVLSENIFQSNFDYFVIHYSKNDKKYNFENSLDSFSIQNSFYAWFPRISTFQNNFEINKTNNDLYQMKYLFEHDLKTNNDIISLITSKSFTIKWNPSIFNNEQFIKISLKKLLKLIPIILLMIFLFIFI